MKLRVDICSRWLLVLAMVFFASFTFAQRTITGTATDAESGEPLIGASVFIVGTSSGTVTDLDGTYSLSLPEGSTQIEFSYTGYATTTITIGTSDIVDVTLSAGETLDEVIVIGYGTVKKSDLTGAVSSVGEEDFNQGLLTSPDQLIQGKAPGVQVTNNSGQPGGATTVRIRGNASIRAGNNPLFVVDGIQLNGSSTKPGGGNTGIGNSPGSNPLNYLNPQDIASIQILKDASATAIYGSRGANGVIIITTKRGKSGDPQVDVSASLGFSNILKRPEVLTGDEYRAALSDYGLTSGDFGDDVNAFDEILRTASTQNHSVAISGGNDNGNYRISMGYLDQEGIVKANALNRISANINGSFKLLDNKRLGMDFGLITTRTNEDAPSVSTNAGFRGSLIGNALQWNPTHRIYNSDGSPVIVPEFGNFTNPVALIDAFSDKVQTTDLIASVSPSYKITDNLTYRMRYSFQSGVGIRRFSVQPWINLENIEGRGIAGINQNDTKQQVLTHTLNYNGSLNSRVTLDGLVGYEYQKSEGRGFGVSARDFIVEDFDFTNILQNSTPDSRSIGSGQGPDTELQSYFARAILNFDNKYLFTGTFRADGSSKFGENNRYGYFPSLAVAWNLHNEDFLQGGPFDKLKFRASWGQTGNQSFDAGASQERYAFGEQSISLANVANPDLVWETTTTINFGFDFALFDYKVTGSLEYFDRRSTDLLFQLPTIQPAPPGLYWINLDGEVVNSGVELALNTVLASSDDLYFDIGGNLTFLDNNLTGYTGPGLVYGALFGQGSTGASLHLLQNDQPLNAFITRDHIEIGDDGQSVYGDNEAQTLQGNPNPSVLLGISTSLRYKDLSFSMNFNGALNQDIFNNTKMSVTPIGNLGSRNIDASLVGTGNQEATSNAIKASSRYIENGSYVKLANATLSYRLGDVGNVARNARIYVTGNNLLVFTNYTGFDPEVNTVNDANGLPSAGIEYIPYPSARTITFGINAQF